MTSAVNEREILFTYKAELKELISKINEIEREILLKEIPFPVGTILNPSRKGKCKCRVLNFRFSNMGDHSPIIIKIKSNGEDYKYSSYFYPSDYDMENPVLPDEGGQ